jgi:hypothetical protein
MMRFRIAAVSLCLFALTVPSLDAQEEAPAAEEPNPALDVFQTDGKNPGSAAYPRAPGRVRQDAPAQHELGRQRAYTDEAINRFRRVTRFPESADPAPWPELDPRFSEAIRMSDDTRSDDFPALASNPADRNDVWMAWASYSGRRDRIHLARRDPETGDWGTWSPVPGVTGDVWRPCLAFDGVGRLWVIWAQQELFDANFDLYARWTDGGRWGPLERLTSDRDGDFDQAVARAPDGTLHLVWQAFRGGRSNIRYMTFDGEEWSEEIVISGGDRNDWAPAIAVDTRGRAHIAWDSYDRGSYDVLLRTVSGGSAGPVREVAASDRFEARPSVTLDGAGRLWVAYEEGEYGWGKDQGRMIPNEVQPGAMLNTERRVAVRVLEGDQFRAATPELTTVFPPKVPITRQKATPSLSNPLLVTDELGRVNLIVRSHLTRRNFTQWWQPYVLTMTADGWSSPALLPYSEGRLSMFAAAAPAPDGGLWVAWPRDNIPTFTVFFNLPEETVIENVYCARYQPGSADTGLQLGDPENPGFEERPPGHTAEVEDVARIRSWRVRAAGRSGAAFGLRPAGKKTYQILRGDTHRHTELSMDLRGSPDGSILDFYRYMLDAAAMDWGMISDHQYASDREYWWWLEEKLADMFHSPLGFLPMFGYERSVSWPNGHRNIIHGERGVPPVAFFLNFDTAFRPHVGSGDVQADDTKLLYDELRRSGGIAVSHTSATNMGTDWRDNDPELEPVVELGQGDRYNYEYLGAPLSNPQEVERGESRFEKGFVAHAWNKGYRLGVILSSDHLSTHISYAMVWAEERSRAGIMEALRARRTYAATDNIVLEFWIGDHFMGEEFAADEVPPIRIKAVGTNTISDIQVIRNNTSIYQNPGGSRELDLSFQDMDPDPGTNFYYLRVQQEDRQTAWSSPIWVNLE